MKKYYKFFIILLVATFIVPQIAFASWWNPFSWNVWNNIFNKSHKPQTTITAPANTPVVSENTPTKTDVIDQTPPLAITCSPNWKCETWSLCKNSLQTRACVDANSCGVLTGKPSVAQACTVVCTPNWQCGNWGVCSNSIQTRACTDANSCGNNNGEPVLNQSCSIPQTTATPTGKNYYYDSLSRLNSLIATETSYKTWLQDTSNQFRSAVNTLSGFGAGGAIGQLRDSSIALANGMITVISSQSTNTEQWISYWQGALDVLKAHPEQAIDQATFNSLKSPESLTSEINGVKSDINSHLNSVMSSITSINSGIDAVNSFNNNFR